MNYKEVNRLEMRLINLRHNLAALSKRGMGNSYYLRELAVAESNLRGARMELEQSTYQLTIDDEPPAA